MEIKIRKACESDADALVTLLAQVGRTHSEGRPDIYCSPLSKHTNESAKKLIADRSGGVIVAETNGKVCGELIYKIFERGCDGFLKARKWLYIDDLCVDESARGNGIASALIAEAENIARGNGCVSVELNCMAFNTAAAKVYEKAGFTPQKTEYEKILTPCDNDK